MTKAPPEIKGEDGRNLLLHPVAMNGKCNIGNSVILKHMRLSMRRKLPQFYRREAHDRECCIVGTGPSVEGDIETIRAFAKANVAIFAVKGAHDYLIDHGIRPSVAVAVDGQEKIAKLYQNPQPDCIYLIASQCHPKVFDALDGYKVIVWHCYTKKVHRYWKDWLRRKHRSDKIYFVQGGSTSGMRTISLAYLSGYRKANLFGFDSCLKDKQDQLLKITGEKNDKELLVAQVEDRSFFCDPAMALQGNEFLPQLLAMGDMRVRVYGDGFIPYVAEIAARKGDWRFVFPDEDWDKLDDPRRGTLPLEPTVVQMPASENSIVELIA